MIVTVFVPKTHKIGRDHDEPAGDARQAAVAAHIR
jgi:hypothetical protein